MKSLVLASDTQLTKASLQTACDRVINEMVKEGDELAAFIRFKAAEEYVKHGIGVLKEKALKQADELLLNEKTLLLEGCKVTVANGRESYDYSEDYKIKQLKKKREKIEEEFNKKLQRVDIEIAQRELYLREKGKVKPTYGEKSLRVSIPAS